eukprot:jgi/Orpsp1_1/1179267/evm.model.c7180000068686.1
MNKFNVILIFLYFICGIFANENLIAINNISPINKRYSLDNFNNISINDKNNLQNTGKIFDLSNIVTVFKNDIQSPKLFKNISVSDIFGIDEENVSKECVELIQSKYSCITLQDTDFALFCKQLNGGKCNYSNNQIKFDIRDKCNVDLGEVEDFVKTVDNIITTKKFFCIKGDKTEEYCPLTKSLQQGYLRLIKETEKNEKIIQKKKRSPLISNVNSFLPSRSIDSQVIKRDLIDDLKKNCNDTICHQKALEYINNIRKEYSYFNLIYEYQINDDTLKKDLLEILHKGECSAAFSKYIIPSQTLLLLTLLVL